MFNYECFELVFEFILGWHLQGRTKEILRQNKILNARRQCSMISNKTFVFHHLEFFENQNEFSANTTV